MVTESMPNLSDRLLRYSATASLITSGILAASSLPVTAADTVIYDGPDIFSTLGTPVYIDLDLAGDAELALLASTSYTVLNPASVVVALSFGTDVQILASAPSWIYPFALSSGYMISGANPNWRAIPAYASLTYNDNIGNWTSMNGETAYLGLSFIGDVTGETHYAWVELSLTSVDNGGPSFVIHRWGIDTTAGAPIPASVDLASASATGGLQAIAAGAFAALGGALTWIRRKLKK